MHPVHASVAGFLRHHDVSRGARVLVAVSGGGDSVALLHVLAALGPVVGVAHVDHGLRGPEADADAGFCEALAGRLGLPFACRSVEAGRRDRRSPEARARALRYAALEQIRRDGNWDWVATGHTRDDQAETLLWRAVRGTGPRGLAGIDPCCRRRRLLRPALALGRADLRAYLAERGLRWREDASNADARIPRNALRRDVLPTLEALVPGAAAHLAGLAEAARELEDALAGLGQAALRPAHGGVCVDLDRLAELAPGLRKRVWMALLERVGLGTAIDARHLRRLDAWADAPQPAPTLSLPRDHSGVRRGRTLWVGPTPRASEARAGLE